MKGKTKDAYNMLFDFPWVLCFSFSSFLNVFLLSVFFFSFDVFFTSLPNQENHEFKYIPLKHEINSKLVHSSVNW